MKISLFLMVFIITTFLFSASATDYTIDNDLIYIDDSNIYLSACPHTLKESGYVYFNLTSKQYTGNIDFYFGFDEHHCKPISAEVLKDGGWIDISNKFRYIQYYYDGMYNWYYLNEISICSNTNYTLRSYLEINEISTGGKYGVAVKPSRETLSQSINNGHFYYLDPWYDGNYLYRKKITLTGNTSGAQTDYQLLFNVTYDSGMQADFDDLRFTNDTHQINAWLKSNTTDYALIWVKFPTTPANGVEQDYYMYYGNNSIASDWNGTNTFDFFDDFNRANSATVGNGWIENPDATFSIENNYLKIDGQNATTEVCYKSYIPVNKRMYYAKMKQTGNDDYPSFGIPSPSGAGYGWIWSLYYPTTGNIVWLDVTGWHGAKSADTNWHDVEFLYNDTVDKTSMILDNIIYASNQNPYAANVLTDINDKVIFKSYDINTLGYIDIVHVRKYVTNPATYVFGSEEKYLYIPPNPINLQNTTGNFWINHTWEAGVGNVTNSYNVSVNDVWHNETINTYWNVTYEYGNNLCQNITVWAYNNTNIGSLSTNSISQNTQLFFTNLPTNLQETHDHTWINWTWGESFLGTHIIDSYNVSINGTWNNGTIYPHYNHINLTYELTSSIIIYGYNNTQGLSIYYISNSYTFPTKNKMVKAIKQLVTPIQIIKDKFFNIIPFIISIILFAGFGLAIMVMTSRLKKW